MSTNTTALELTIWRSATQLGAARSIDIALRLFAKSLLDLSGMPEARRQEVGAAVDCIAEEICMTLSVVQP